MKSIVLFLAFGIILLGALTLPATNATAAPTAVKSSATAVPTDPYVLGSALATTARPITLCQYPVGDCHARPDGVSCGDPELGQHCHCTTVQGTHYCVKDI